MNMRNSRPTNRRSNRQRLDGKTSITAWTYIILGAVALVYAIGAGWGGAVLAAVLVVPGIAFGAFFLACLASGYAQADKNRKLRRIRVKVESANRPTRRHF